MFAPNDQPPLAFYQAPKTWGPDDTQKAMTARTIMQQTIKSGDPKSIAAAVDAISPMYKDDPNYDISKLIDPSVWTNMNQLQKERLDIMKRAGVISEKSLDLRSRKIDSDIQLAQTRQGLLQYTAQQKQIENTFLPQELQTRIQKMQSDMTNSTKNAATAAGTLQQKIAQNQITNLNADKAAALKARGQLNSSIIAMQNQARALVAAGQDQTPVTGDDGQPTTLGAQLASQIVAAQKQRDDLNAAVGIADNPQTQAAAIKQQLPNAKNVSTDPAKVNQIMAYYKQLTPAQRAQYINRPDMPADVRAKLQAMP
jgi:cob(I)alamin adenosyltransferase